MRARLLLLLLALVEGVIPSTHWVVTETGKIQAQVSTARSATVYSGGGLTRTNGFWVLK